VGLGANHGHVGGLTVPLAVIFERPKKKVHTHAKGSGQFFGRISMYSKVRQSMPLSVACHATLRNRAVAGQAQYPRYAPTATCTQASRRPQGADP
jgi:hypothetical protein